MSRVILVVGVLGAVLALVGGALVLGVGQQSDPVRRTAAEAPVIDAAPSAAPTAAPRDVAKQEPTPTPTATSTPRAKTMQVASRPWVRTMAARTGIAAPALQAYANASLRMAVEKPGCKIGWTTLAGIGQIETGHGQGVLGRDGRASRAIEGPSLDGSGGYANIQENGTYARARGPMQFIAPTWRTWAADGDGDGERSVDDVDDAALAAGRYLCHDGRDLTTPSGWSAAIFSYNHSDEYVKSVLAAANGYAARA